MDKEIKLRILSKALEKKILQDETIKSDLNFRYTYILNWLKNSANEGKSDDDLKADLKKHFAPSETAVSGGDASDGDQSDK